MLKYFLYAFLTVIGLVISWFIVAATAATRHPLLAETMNWIGIVAIAWYVYKTEKT